MLFFSLSLPFSRERETEEGWVYKEKVVKKELSFVLRAKSMVKLIDNNGGLAPTLLPINRDSHDSPVDSETRNDSFDGYYLTISIIMRL